MPGLEGSISYDTSSPPTRALMSDGDEVSEQVKRFVFRSRKTEGCAQGDKSEESLEILIPEVRRTTILRAGMSRARLFSTRASYRLLRASWLGRYCSCETISLVPRLFPGIFREVFSFALLLRSIRFSFQVCQSAKIFRP